MRYNAILKIYSNTIKSNDNGSICGIYISFRITILNRKKIFVKCKNIITKNVYEKKNVIW